MKILITVDPEIPVPPTNYGGIERIVDSLIGAFKSQGHQVFLVANPESSNNEAEKIYGWPALHSRGKANVIKNAKYLSKVAKEVKPSVIHSFSRLLYLYPIFLRTKIPVIQTYQRAISPNSTQLALKIAGKKLHFTSCGEHMIKQHPIAGKCTPVHNFTDTTYYSDKDTLDKEFLFFLGRVEEIKGTKEAIETALATKQKLVIAGNIQPGHDEYFNTHVKPHLDNPLIEYVGPVNDEQKLYYLQRAKAFLFPIKWEEPFGIVMAEAMACGVPVIGFRRGSVPEVVKEGETGFVVDDVNGMIEAVNKIDSIDRKVVRKDCEYRFSLEVISKKYLTLFDKMLT
jgi:glycosyltransferase involved in cell wall biosynthesis